MEIAHQNRKNWLYWEIKAKSLPFSLMTIYIHYTKSKSAVNKCQIFIEWQSLIIIIIIIIITTTTTTTTTTTSTNDNNNNNNNSSNSTLYFKDLWMKSNAQNKITIITLPEFNISVGTN